MPHDPQRSAEVREWLTKALHDLMAANALLHCSPMLPDVAVYHCQQAAEKAFKAFLFQHDVLFRKTHELEELGGACAALDASLAPLVKRAVELTPFAWRFRYPGDLAAPLPQDAESALTLAREVYEAVSVRLPVEARP